MEQSLGRSHSQLRRELWELLALPGVRVRRRGRELVVLANDSAWQAAIERAETKRIARRAAKKGAAAGRPATESCQ